MYFLCFEYTVAEDAGSCLEKGGQKEDCKYSIPNGMEEMKQPSGFSRRETDIAVNKRLSEQRVWNWRWCENVPDVDHSLL